MFLEAIASCTIARFKLVQVASQSMFVIGQMLVYMKLISNSSHNILISVRILIFCFHCMVISV